MRAPWGTIVGLPLRLGLHAAWVMSYGRNRGFTCPFMLETFPALACRAPRKARTLMLRQSVDIKNSALGRCWKYARGSPSHATSTSDTMTNGRLGCSSNSFSTERTYTLEYSIFLIMMVHSELGAKVCFDQSGLVLMGTATSGGPSPWQRPSLGRSESLP